MTACVVITTCASETEASAIARHLVEQHLAACVQFVPIQSIYRWQGDVYQEPEVQLMIKTRAALFGAIEREIRTLHSYEEPEIIVLPIQQGSASYLAWIGAQTGAEG
ncbi:MAG: divalent-cation tolerance protein CutA [Cyanobacteria bacterium P01_G01_bin.54]